MVGPSRSRTTRRTRASQPDPRVKQIAEESLAWVKRANLRLSEVYIDRAVTQRRGSYTVTPSQFMSGNFSYCGGRASVDRAGAARVRWRLPSV